MPWLLLLTLYQAVRREGGRPRVDRQERSSGVGDGGSAVPGGRGSDVDGKIGREAEAAEAPGGAGGAVWAAFFALHDADSGWRRAGWLGREQGDRPASRYAGGVGGRHRT